MRSVPLAIGWEMLRRGRWPLILYALVANALPVLLFTGLKAIDPADLSQIIMHTVLVQINLFAFGTGVLFSLGPMSRLYTYPVSNASLVAWHVLLGMVAVSLEMVASIAILNAMFDLGWRLWGPALFAAATFAALLSALWLAEKSGWMVVTVSVVLIPLCLWLKSRYGPLFSPPKHYWGEVTPAEALFLAAVPIVAYFVGIFGVARNRCGSPPYSIGLMAWLQRAFAFGPETGLALRDPLRAQLWYEWRTKGVVIPATVGTGLFMGTGIWLLASRDANALFEGFIAGGAMLALACSLGGSILGKVGRADTDIQIGQFLATRPLTNVQLAGTILKTTAKSVFLGWGIWALAFVIVYAILLALRVTLRATLPAPLGWWYVPVALLGAWTAAGVMVALVLTGRQNLVAWFLFAAVTLTVGLICFAKMALSPQTQDYLAQGLAVFSGIVFVLGTIGALVAARRRELISGPTLSAAAVTWGALCVLAALFWLPSSVERLTVYVLIVGVLALSVAPLATAPLALAWNRTR